MEPTQDLPINDPLVSLPSPPPDTPCCLDDVLDPVHDGLLPDIELEKLLHPFANSIVGADDCWDIDSLFAL